MAEPEPDGNEGLPERGSRFITQREIDPRLLETLLAQAQSKFPEKLDAIVRKYGAFEYETSDDGLVSFTRTFLKYIPDTHHVLQEVLDIVPPADYIEHNDHQEMERWASGDVGALNFFVHSEFPPLIMTTFHELQALTAQGSHCPATPYFVSPKVNWRACKQSGTRCAMTPSISSIS